ncbi:hypothetical protein T07_1561 [Trichinella nelsoni]|uniref:Uncharacterized protein n=1 Tax=Trichinella nelsoni TaxID=6336 RepID=A0A0V0RE97_9BILA|nr:hypothetical protein T07_1561 [Trichinella nelsoni]
MTNCSFSQVKQVSSEKNLDNKCWQRAPKNNKRIQQTYKNDCNKKLFAHFIKLYEMFTSRLAINPNPTELKEWWYVSSVLWQGLQIEIYRQTGEKLRMFQSMCFQKWKSEK